MKPRRLATDAKIVLERAGYSVDRDDDLSELIAFDNIRYYAMKIESGTVDNAEVVELLGLKGFNEFGYARKSE